MAIDLKELLDELIGPITPVGASHHDERLFANQQRLQELTEYLLERIHCVSRDKDSKLASVAKAGDSAHKFLTRMKEEVC